MKKVKLVVFIIILLALIFDTNLCFAQNELKVGRRRITTISFETTEPKVKWEIEDSSIAEIISIGNSGITVGSYFKGSQYAKVRGIKTGTTIIKAYNESGKLLQQGTLIVEEIKTDISKCEIPYITDQEFTGDKIEPYIEITGENGIIKNSQNSKLQTEIAAGKETLQIMYIEQFSENRGNNIELENYLNYIEEQGIPTKEEDGKSKIEKGWFVPSKSEWAAFGGEVLEPLNITASNYGNYGLSSWCWSSSQRLTYTAYGATFSGGSIRSNFVDTTGCVRLAATF